MRVDRRTKPLLAWFVVFWLAAGAVAAGSPPGGSPSDINGASNALFQSLPAIGWERADGTAANPITAPGPSLKVSRTEHISPSACGGVFNNNECNAAILGVSAQSPNYASSADMQIAGVVGESLVYSNSPGAEGVGVQGIARAVGAATAGVAGGYFEGRYDSTAPRSHRYTVGVEARSGNLSGADATPDVAGGNNYDAILASCGEGSWKAWKCNAGVVVLANNAQYWDGFLVSNGATVTNGFDEEDRATTAYRIGGTHANQILGENFAVTGSGSVWIGPDYSSTTSNGLTVLQAGSNQAYFGSSGTNASFVNIDDRAGGQSSAVQFDDAGLPKWQVGKSVGNDFFVWDSAASRPAVLIASGASLASSYPVVLPVYRVATLPVCGASLRGAMASVSDATNPTYNGSLTGGGGATIPVFCNGSAWTAH
jgi:hypothetical protein